MMRRILFVDDERQVLDGLRALLRPQRSQWEMVFVESGEQALAELQQARFDVIVSDMKMPVMDGATLLRRTQALHPGVVRIVLSGFVEFETALRTVPVAHQFLIKPCDAAVLVNVIERACALQELILADAVREVAGPTAQLPSLPELYLALTQVFANEGASVADGARVIARDPIVVARVLQLVNSAFLGLGRDITSIEQAITYVGTNMLKNMVLAAQVFGSGSSPAEGLWMYRIQRHSLLVGTIARRLAAADRRMSEDAFIAGILHDIGKQILFARRPEVSASIERRARAEGRPGHEIEQEELGVTHAELGGYLLSLWGLPYPVIEAAANHHAPRRVPQPAGLGVLAAVHAADALANELAWTSLDADLPFSPLDEDYLRTLGVHDLLPEWREIAASCMGANRSAHWIENPGARAA